MHIDHIETPFRLAVPLPTALSASTVGRTGRFGDCPKFGTGYHIRAGGGFPLVLGTQTSRWEGNIKMNVRKILCSVCVSTGSSSIASEWAVAVTLRYVASYECETWSVVVKE